LDRSVRFGEGEQVLCVAECSLDVKTSGILKKKAFIVIGTAFQRGEDTAVRGRVSIFLVP
jgi:hypothetical protein